MLATMSTRLTDSPWTQPGTVAGFATSPPNRVLLSFAEAELARAPGGLSIDIGCGAGRNAVPLAELGWQVVGTDLSEPMLQAAVVRAAEAGVGARTVFALAAMDALPVRAGSADLIIAHGIWNLARSAAEFRRGIAEAARIARSGAALFVFTFSRHTLADDAQPVTGERFVFTQFSGGPQCFLSESQLLEELGAHGFRLDPAVPLSEYNRPAPGALPTGRAPVIYEAAFRYDR